MISLSRISRIKSSRTSLDYKYFLRPTLSQSILELVVTKAQFLNNSNETVLTTYPTVYQLFSIAFFSLFPSPAPFQRPLSLPIIFPPPLLLTSSSSPSSAPFCSLTSRAALTPLPHSSPQKVPGLNSVLSKVSCQLSSRSSHPLYTYRLLFLNLTVLCM